MQNFGTPPAGGGRAYLPVVNKKIPYYIQFFGFFGVEGIFLRFFGVERWGNLRKKARKSGGWGGLVPSPGK